MLTNEQIEKRNEILGLKNCKWLGGIRKISDISASVIKELIDSDFIDLKDAQNVVAPTNEDFYDFMLEHPGFTAYGSVYDDGSTCPIYIEGLMYCGPLYDKYKNYFVYFARYADEFAIDDCLYCRWC